MNDDIMNTRHVNFASVDNYCRENDAVLVSRNEYCKLIEAYRKLNATPEVHHEDLLVWHYCSEELPKKNGLYFVTWLHNDSCYICLKEFADGRWKSTLNIIAWMPCPKPCTKKKR